VIHVALLRGINVGGNNKIPMAHLRRLCQDLGWTEVVSYINSGNVVFAAERSDHLAMAQALEDAIEHSLGFRPRVLVKSGEDVAAIAAAIPASWTNDAAMKSDVVYLLDGVDAAQASATLAPRAGVDHVVNASGAFIWMVSRSDATRSGLHGMVATPLYRQATVRNVNTARKLAALVTR
jgi:uncharacterized protein (DUF1697 family)